MQSQSRWMRATAPSDKLSYSEEEMKTAFSRRCTLWIWPPAHVRGSLTSSTRAFCTAWLPDGRIICAGGNAGAGADHSSAEVWEATDQGGADAAWTWRELPAISVARSACCGFVMSDGRFAVLGGSGGNGDSLSSCEALVFGDAAHWVTLTSMPDSRAFFACAAVAGCVVVAGGTGCKSAEVYDESRNRWLRLPHDLPYENELRAMGSALL